MTENSNHQRKSKCQIRTISVSLNALENGNLFYPFQIKNSQF